MANIKFFEKQGPLSIEERTSHKEEQYVEGTFEQVIQKELPKEGTFTVIAHSVHALQFGIFTKGQFAMNDKKAIDDKWVQQVRLFNDREEWLCKKVDAQVWWVRHIVDGEGDCVKTVDASSSFMGEKVAIEVPQGFVALHEKGRKLTYVISVEGDAKHYSLVTRSYITHDFNTGQAGYGYSRYVAIETGAGRKGDA